MTRVRLDYVHEYRDRHGKLRRYFRRPGFRRIALSGLPGSDEFMAAYQLALAGQPKPIGAERTRPGTVNAAIVGYYTSPSFRELATGSQRKYRNVLERFREEHGDKRIASLPREFIVRALGKKSRYAARNWFKAIRALMKLQSQKASAPMTQRRALRYRRLRSRPGFIAGPKPRLRNTRPLTRSAPGRISHLRYCSIADSE